MRTIPASIIEKLKSLQQTKANNADPRINLVMQRTRRYIEQGSTLNPVTLWDRPGLGSIDVSYRRESRMTAPDKIYVIYIENGEAHVARTDYIKSIEQANEWEYLYTLGPAVDCAIEFDGRWERTHRDAEVCFDSPAQWTHVTMGDPYIFLVLADGSLTVQQGQGAPTTLATGVSKVAALRGWKNVYRWQHDHGIICAYIKESAVYYRTFALQGTDANPQPAVWEVERLVDTLPTPAVNVGLFRTNDYRVGILCESAGEIHWAITDRNWAGMAIRDHTVRARGTRLLAQLINVIYDSAYSPPHTIATTGAEVSALYCPAMWPEVVSLSNPGPDDAVTILIECDLDLYGDLTGLEAAFTVQDSISTNFAVTATAKGVTDKIIKLTVANFEAAVGDLTVTYVHATAPIYSQVDGGCLMELFGFFESFTPNIAPPEGYTAHTITATGEIMTCDFLNVTYSPGYHIHTITVTAGAILVDFIHVDDIPP